MKIRFLFSAVLLLICIVSKSENVDKVSNRIKYVLSNNPEIRKISVWIYFTDKGDSDLTIKAKENIILPANSLKRRSKVFSDKKPLITWYDISLCEKYIADIQPYTTCVRHKSRWLNAVSAEILVESLDKLKEFSFIKRIDLLSKGKNREEQYTSIAFTTSPQPKKTHWDINYGISYNQNQLIRTPELHALGLTGNNVIICMMDAGYNNLSHTSLQHIEILGTWDFVNNDSNVADENDFGTGIHGTLTLSALGGFNTDTLIGPAYGAKFILTKTENTESETQIEEDNWIAAIEWAEENFGPDITSTSLGYNDFDNGFAYTINDLDGNTAAITIAADIAASLGILVINSAGNSGPGSSTLGVPADGDSVLAIGATTSAGDIADFSSRGPTADGRIKPDVCAQGVLVASASPNDNGYVYASGTSLSCPLVAGAAALLIEAFPTVTNMQVFDALKITANKSYNPDNNNGWGVINSWAAYNYLSGKPHISHKPLTETYVTDPYYSIESKIYAINNNVDLVKVVYRINNGSWQNLLLTSVGEFCYIAQIPQAACFDQIDYYIYADNTVGISTFPENAPTGYISFIVGATDINDINKEDELLIAPNPVKNKISFKGINTDLLKKIEVFNSLGQSVYTNNNYSHGQEIDISDLSSGTYYIKAELDNTIKILRFIKIN